MYKYILLYLIFIIPLPVLAQIENAYLDNNPMHWSRFWARAVMDRNLIWCPVWNVGLLSDSEVGPDNYMCWPGSQGLEYMWEGVFYIAAQVDDMSDYQNKIVPDERKSDIIAIISSTHTKNLSNRSEFRTHTRTWAPVPGFFNGGPYGWIEGISEDINKNGELDPGEDINFNGVLDHSIEPPESILNSMAISTDKRTWPKFWPGGTYHGDDRAYYDRPPRTIEPGKRAGLWNGEYRAAPIADQETLFRMDDHENDYYGGKITNYKYWPMKNTDGTPDTRTWDEGGIAGAGIEVEGRTYAWYHPLAEDLLISVYRIRNYSDYDLPYVIAGMWADIHVGGHIPNNPESRANNAADYIMVSYDDSGRRTDYDILYQWHLYPNTLATYKKIGTFGFAYLESPGIDYNDKDDDFDGYIDESMNNLVDDDGDWQSFSDTGLDGLLPGDPDYPGPDTDGTEGNGSWDTEDLNSNSILDPGEDINNNDRLDYENPGDDLGSDGLGPDHYLWPGPDTDGTECNRWHDPGEPNFDQTDLDEADQAGLKYVYVYEEFGDDIFLSDQQPFWDKFFRYSEGRQKVISESDNDICFHFGTKGVRLKKNDWQRFTIALVMGEDRDDAIRNKSTMQLIYDNNYRFLTPPLQPLLVANVSDKAVQLSWDSKAESSKDPLFGHDFNGYRIYKSTNPKFLDIKTITDGFGNAILFKPLAIYDKNDGLTGIHPIDFPGLNVSYDMGTDIGLRHSYLDEQVDNGRTYFYAVTAIDAGNDHDFYNRGLVENEKNIQAIPSESPFSITVNLLGNVIYRDKNTAVCVPTEPSAGFIEPYVDALNIEHIGNARGGQYNINVFNKKKVNPGHRYEITFSDDGWLAEETYNFDWGRTTGIRCVNITSGDTLFDIQYNTTEDFVQNFPSTIEDIVSEGLHFDFKWPFLSESNNDKLRGINLITYNSSGRNTNEWKDWKNPTISNIILDNLELANTFYALPLPRDFEVRIYDTFNIDTSISIAPWVGKYNTNFGIWDITNFDNPIKMPIAIIYEKDMRSNSIPPEMFGQIWDGTRIVILCRDSRYKLRSSWQLRFKKDEYDKQSEIVPPQPGDIFRFNTERSPTHLDTMRFTIEGGIWQAEQAKNDMRNIYVVPDPYVVANSLEPIYEIDGTTQRRIDFVNLPPQCKISIFTASGKLVRKLEHNAPEDFGRESWDLRTADGPEIAFGMYFFVVEAEGVGITRGKFAVIK